MLHLNVVSSYFISSIKIVLVRKKLDQQENYRRVYTTVLLWFGRITGANIFEFIGPASHLQREAYVLSDRRCLLKIVTT